MKDSVLVEASNLLRNPSLSETCLPDGTVVILDIDRHQVLSASPVGAFVLNELRDGVHSLSDLAARIAAEFDVDQAQAERDARTFIADLMRALSTPVS